VEKIIENFKISDTDSLRVLIDTLRQPLSIECLNLIINNTKSDSGVIEGCTVDFLTSQLQMTPGTFYFRVGLLHKAGLVHTVKRPDQPQQYIPNYELLHKMRGIIDGIDKYCFDNNIQIVTRTKNPPIASNRGRFRPQTLKGQSK
jgi:hypothetical protein